MRKVFNRCLVFGALLWFSGSAACRDIAIVQVAPFTGSQAVTGKAISAGAKLYFDHVNAQGGVNGALIRLIKHDDQQKPDETVRLINESVRVDHPMAFIGTVGTTNFEALIKDGVLEKSGIPLVGAISGASSLIGAPGLFTVKASYRDEVDSLFSRLAPLNQKRVGVVFQNDALGKDVLAGVEVSSKKYGVEVIQTAGYERNTIKVEETVNAMLKANPQSIVLGATTAAAIEFVRQYRERGGTSTLYGLSIIDTQQLMKKLGPVTARGYAFSVVVPQEKQLSVPLNREYLRLKKESTDPDLAARSIEGYIAAQALVAALRKGGGSPAELHRALKSMEKLDLGGYMLDFSSSKRMGSNYVDFAMFGEGGRVFQ